jgi:hypothetical protein
MSAWGSPPREAPEDRRLTAISLWLRVALTVVLIGSGGYCLRRCFTRVDHGTAGGTGTVGRINSAVHVYMCLEMTAMLWAVAVPDRWALRPLLLGAGAVWFAAQATGVRWSRRAFVVDPGPVRGPSCGAGASRVQCVHHALLLAVMAWMTRPDDAVPMPSMRSGIGSGTAVITAGLGIYCLVVAVLWTGVRLRRRRDGAGTRHAVSLATMTAVMGVALLGVR